MKGLQGTYTRRRVARAGRCLLLLLFPLAGWTADGLSSAPSKPSLGGAIECRLPAPSFVAEHQVLLDLDTGELLPMPTNIWTQGFNNPRPRFTWMVHHGADLLVHSSEVSTNLTFHLDDGRLAILETNISFTSFTVEDAEKALSRGAVFQHLEIPKPGMERGVALAFKTREGGIGVMQLLEFSAKPEPRLRLRYRLLRQGAGARAVPSSPP